LAGPFRLLHLALGNRAGRRIFLLPGQPRAGRGVPQPQPLAFRYQLETGCLARQGPVRLRGQPLVTPADQTVALEPERCQANGGENRTGPAGGGIPSAGGDASGPRERSGHCRR
jgi:hypothetical protein